MVHWLVSHFRKDPGMVVVSIAYPFIIYAVYSDAKNAGTIFTWWQVLLITVLGGAFGLKLISVYRKLIRQADDFIEYLFNKAGIKKDSQPRIW